MKTFAEWLDEFRKEVTKGYEYSTMVKALSEHIHDNYKQAPTNLLMFDGPPTASTAFQGAAVTTIKIGLRAVTALNAGFNFDLKDWADDPTRISYSGFMSKLGQIVADNEYRIITYGMVTYAGDTINAKQKGKLSKDDIAEAQRHVQGAYGDSIIMHPMQEAEFWKSGQIFERVRVPTFVVPEERRGCYYVGMIDGVNIYSSSFVKGIAIVFSRREMIFASTPLEISFDSMAHPKKLILKKMCASAPMFDEAVVKIQL